MAPLSLIFIFYLELINSGHADSCMADMTKSTVAGGFFLLKINTLRHHTGKKIVLTWCISMYHVIGLKQTSGINVTLKAAKNFVGVAVNWEE